MPSFSNLVNQILGEVSPKGWEGTVKAMKDEPGIDNPWALAHWMKGEGYKSHKKEAGGDEPFAGDRNLARDRARDKQSLTYYQVDPVRVVVTHGSGTTSGKTGTVVSPREVKTDGRGIPTNVQGAYHQVDWNAEVAVRMDDGELITMYKERLSRINEEPPAGMMAKKEQEGDEEGDPYADYEEQQRPDYNPGGRVDWEWDTNRPGEEMEENAGGDWGGPGTGQGMGTGTPYVGDIDMRADKEGARVVHPTKGGNQPGTVTAISESGVTVDWDNLQKRLTTSAVLPFEDAKYLNIIDEYSEASPERKEQMPKKEKVDENLIMIAMAPIGGTMLTRRPSDDFNFALTYEDIGLVIEDDEEDDEKDDENDSSNSDKPWEKSSDSNSSNSNGRSELRKSSEGGADYTNVPRPGDTVLTNQESQPKVKTDPLATMDGAESAGDGDAPDGDYGSDLVPVDAPDVPDYRDGDYGNARKAGSGEADTNEVSDSDSGDYNDTKPEDKKKVEEGNMDLTYRDLGLKILNEAEMGQGVSGYAEDYHGMRETHEPGHGEIAMSRELLDKLLMAVSKQSPEKEELDAICQGLESASSQKGETLDVEDVDMIKSEMSKAFSGGGEEPAAPEGDDYADAEPDVAPEGGEYDDTEQDAEEDMGGGDSNEAGDTRHKAQGYGDGEGMGDDSHGKKAGDYKGSAYSHEDKGDDDYYDYEEDRAEGDGKVAGPEGGDEHKGKRQLMDKKGIDRDNDGDVDSDDWKIGRDKAIKRSKAKEATGSGTPIGTGSHSGPGGGSTQDLSKPKNQRPSKPLGNDKGRGPGGSSADEFGQKPTDDGGSNLVPANPDGSSRATPQGPWSDTTELNPQGGKALVAESKRKRTKRKGTKRGKQQVDEAIMLGMAAIPGTMRNYQEVQIENDDPDAELKMMRRRAGIEKCWIIT